MVENGSNQEQGAWINQICVTDLNKILAAARDLEQLMTAAEAEAILKVLLPMMQTMTKFTKEIGELQSKGFYRELTLAVIFDPLNTFMEVISRGEVKEAAQLVLRSIVPVLEDWQRSLNITPVVGLIFSKDRAMQLDATLRSYYLHCQDPQLAELKVLYLASSEQHRQQYQVLQQDYPEVSFIAEKDFKAQTLELMNNHQYVLFLVDDNLFVRDFSLQPMLDALIKYPDAIGFSFRLGWNAVYCYTHNCQQKVPAFKEIENGMITYDWTQGEHDFGYPLEISSSLYRLSDLKPILQQLSYSNPTTLEGLLSLRKDNFAHCKNLMCNKYTITFCVPVNRVQEVNANDCGRIFAYSSEELSEKFQQGYRIDVERYKNYLPMACHEEVELHFVQIAKKLPPVTNQAKLVTAQAEVTKVEVINNVNLRKL
ncbi:hypothetical protein B0537_06640 [Desulforamulus ferrireducens]|uniref:Uncharacterized protein n=2 Tax=Desulforamulus ferrireducens TaxID=1833852 RepID=A0A1S6IVK0_9FIRM|nr:hypothetical protein B0537_06640 [Desulforamulus ferrireducens]